MSLEYCQGASLSDLIMSYDAIFEEEHVAYIMKAALLGLQYMHSKYSYFIQIRAFVGNPICDFLRAGHD